MVSTKIIWFHCGMLPITEVGFRLVSYDFIMPQLCLTGLFSPDMKWLHVLQYQSIL